MLGDKFKHSGFSIAGANSNNKAFFSPSTLNLKALRSKIGLYPHPANLLIFIFYEFMVDKDKPPIVRGNYLNNML